MSIKIDSDLGRFKDIVRGKIKNNLGKFVSSNDLIGQQGGKLIKIPIKHIDMPHFTYGSRDVGGIARGLGDAGDPIDGQGKPGKGKAGDNEGEQDFNAEFSPEELAQLVIEELELPALENKGKGAIHSEKNKYNKIANQGSESLRHNKRTFKEALKRGISSGVYNPFDPQIIPIKEDKRYKSYSTKESPEINTAVFYIIDISGSMTEIQRDMAKTITFWTDLLLSHSYKGIENIFIAHDTTAEEVSREEFFKLSTGGGTKISSAYKLCAEIIEEQYPFSEWNNYIFDFSDGDNFSEADNELCYDILTNKLLPNSNMFAYGQTTSNGGSGEFIDFLGSRFADNDKVVLSQMDSLDDILKTIKAFFERGR